MATTAPRLRTTPFARFSMVSVVSTAITLVTIAILSDTGRFNGLQIAAVATTFGFACSYPLNRRWAFENRSGAGHAVAVLWLGGLSLVGLLLCSVAGAAVDLVAAHMHLGATAVLAAEETAESVVLGALFVVRFAVSRALFEGVAGR
jgi:putative flippase GtrA